MEKYTGETIREIEEGSDCGNDYIKITFESGKIIELWGSNEGRIILDE